MAPLETPKRNQRGSDDFNRARDLDIYAKGCRTTSNSSFSNSMISVLAPSRVFHQESGSNSEYGEN